MERIYLDNAATTPLDPEVFDVMKPYFLEKFGNPSSIYSYGREAKLAVENARKSVAKLLGAHPGEIFFTSGGTESSNAAIAAGVKDLGCKHIISSPIEHHATLHSVEFWGSQPGMKLSFVELDEKGHVKLNSLQQLLESSEEKCLVSLMHANNEIGNLLKVKAVSELCEKNGAIFHCDTVQTVGHYPINLKDLKIHFANGASHKFHGPKGVGMLYINENLKISPMLQGGSQERNMRAGTENVYGIVGFAKALELAMDSCEADSAHILGLKKYMIEQLSQHIPEVQFNGDYDGSCLYTVLNVSFPKSAKTDLILMSLDIAGICVSGGSACSSGASSVSHVVKALGESASQRVPIRFSFSKHNKKQDIDSVIAKLKELL